jgi:hypothetical protein
MNAHARCKVWFSRLLAIGMLCSLGCGSSSDEPPRDGDPGREPDDPDDRDREDAATPGANAGRGGSGSGASGNDSGGSSGSSGSNAGDGGLAPGHIETDGGLDCAAPPVNQLPSELSCTGLYADIESKEIAPGVRAFAPASELWSDGADKQRWIFLPEGTQIDTSVQDDWQFPVGTQLWKEFSWNGHRVETRLFEKTGDNRWLKAAYHWNADETRATRFAGGEVDVAGETYYIPSAKECDQCHKGRDDRALGFELISLALPGATGLTLSALMAEGLLTDEPTQATFEIGDDGTGHAAPALAWMHVNCGVSCHNGNPAAEGYSSDLRLRLPAEGIDGRSPAEFDSVVSTVGVDATTPRWLDRKRIAAGSPEDSLVYFLASTRDPNNPKDQMPPIASRRVDQDGLMLLESWISALPATP